jgi:hypothetical protein
MSQQDFELVKEWMTISHVNIRTELHGDENSTAVDIKLEHDFHNALLSKFSPDLLTAIYTRNPNTTEDMLNPDHKPHLVNEKLIMPLRWDLELDPVKVTLHDDGGDDRNDIVFSGAKLNKFAFDCKEGGTVHFTARLQISDIDHDQTATIVGLLNEDVKISVELEAKPVEQTKPETNGEAPDNVHPLFPVEGSGEQDEEEDEPLTEEEQAEDEAAAARANVDPEEAFEAAYAQAVEFAKTCNRLSVSILTRQLKFEGQTATRILERMEEEGLVGQPNPQGLREVIEQAA